MLSLSVRKNKKFSNHGASVMSLSAVLHASQGDIAPAAMAAVPTAKCFGQHAPTVVKIPQYLLNLELVDGCIVAIATVKSE